MKKRAYFTKKNNRFRNTSAKLTAAAMATVILATSTLTGCAGLGITGTAHAGKNAGIAKAQSTLKKEYEGVAVNIAATSDFDKTLAEFLEKSGYADQNYMISPTSFRSALALAVAGADNETKEELIHAMGFESMDEMNAWYYSVTKIVNDFDESFDEQKKEFEEHKDWYDDDAKAPEGSLILLNSVWNNTDKGGKFGKEYINYVENYYGAEANDVKAGEITNKINNWVNEGTNGLIPQIADNLSSVNAALINTLYLKSSWEISFSKAANTIDTFKTSDGSEVAREFMNNQDSYKYYEDKNGKLVVIPMNGGIDVVFVLGEIKDVHDALAKASSEEVRIQLPKFEVESSFDSNEFLFYLMDRGAERAFDERADFSIMSPDKNLFISDIIQKTKIKVDEDGLEAAAATAVLMLESCMEITEEPKEFIANEPFRFYICGGENDDEILFCGQIVK